MLCPPLVSDSVNEFWEEYAWSSVVLDTIFLFAMQSDKVVAGCCRRFFSWNDFRGRVANFWLLYRLLVVEK